MCCRLPRSKKTPPHSLLTDVKLCKKAINYYYEIAKNEKLPQRQTYVRVSKQLFGGTHNSKYPKHATSAKKGKKESKDYRWGLIRKIEQNYNDVQAEKYGKKLKLYYQVINQKRTDKNKIYSIHTKATAQTR